MKDWKKNIIHVLLNLYLYLNKSDYDSISLQEWFCLVKNKNSSKPPYWYHIGWAYHLYTYEQRQEIQPTNDMNHESSWLVEMQGSWNFMAYDIIPIELGIVFHPTKKAFTSKIN